MKLDRPITEYNATRLGLISFQSRLNPEHRMGWESIREEQGNRSGIICRTSDPSGVPCGIASDILSGLLTEAAIQHANGTPPGTDLHLTPAAIARSAHLKLHARHYPGIERSLQSLANTKYNVFTDWRDPFTRTFRNATFSIIDALQVTRTQHLFNDQQMQTNYVCRLNSELTRSIEGGLVLAINAQILTALASPGARAMYRMLETLRRDPGDITRALSSIDLSSGELLHSTRFLSGRQESGHLLRVIQPMFEDLRKAGYLQSFDLVGRGWKTRVHLRFQDDGRVHNAEGCSLLMEAGVFLSSAQGLATAHTHEEIQCALWMTEDIARKRTVANPPGMIVKFLKDGEALANIPTFRERRRARHVPPTAARRTAAPPAAPARALQAPLPDTDAAEGVLRSLVSLGKIHPAQHPALCAAVAANRVQLSQIGGLITRSKADVQAQLTQWGFRAAPPEVPVVSS